MILLDVNVLLYAHDSSSDQYERARKWLGEALSGAAPVALAWASILGFLRISTSPRLFEEPLSLDKAVSVVSEWLAQPAVTILNPGDHHWGILSGLLEEGQARGPLVMDAHLAALAIEHGATLCTTDRDFTRFPKLKTFNPLEASP